MLGHPHSQESYSRCSVHRRQQELTNSLCRLRNSQAKGRAMQWLRLSFIFRESRSKERLSLDNSHRWSLLGTLPGMHVPSKRWDATPPWREKWRKVNKHSCTLTRDKEKAERQFPKIYHLTVSCCLGLSYDQRPYMPAKLLWVLSCLIPMFEAPHYCITALKKIKSRPNWH